MGIAHAAAVTSIAVMAGCAGSTAPVPPTPSHPGFSLHIADARTDLRADTLVVIDATFRNPGDAPATVILPQDGSFDRDDVPPRIHLVVERLPDLKEVRPLPRGCGNCGGSYDARTMVEIPAGGERTLRIPAPWFPPEPGRYRVRMRYEVRQGDYPGPRLRIPAADEPARRDWPRGVFVGVVESAPVEFDCVGTR